MPTGYTADVQSGKITTLREFALRCARGMGACIMMRDEPWDAPIPERFEPSDYHVKKLAEAQARHAELLAMTRDEATEAAKAAHAKALEEYDRRERERREQAARYTAMLDQVRAWNTKAEGIQDFMVEQLEKSIDFDCSSFPEDDPMFGKPRLKQGEDWRADELAKAAKDIAYHSKENAEDVARTEGRNRWLADLRASLTDPA